MSHSIHVSEDGSHIVLKFVGPAGRAGFAGVVEAHAEGAKLGIRRFLVDLTEATNPDSPLDDYEMANVDFPHTPVIDRFAHVVALVRPGDHTFDFLVTVFLNSGSYLEIFADREAALSALLRPLPADT